MPCLNMYLILFLFFRSYIFVNIRLLRIQLLIVKLWYLCYPLVLIKALDRILFKDVVLIGQMFDFIFIYL